MATNNASAKAQHTAGPWIRKPGANDAGAIHSAATGRGVASVHFQESAEEYEANARLIAAAPDMRALLNTIVGDDPFDDDADEGPFCKFLCGATDRSKPHPDDCAWAQARALLARIDARETT